MAKPWAKVFYNSTQWKQCRASYISYRQSIDGGICEDCGERLGYIVHHKSALTPRNINDTNVSLNHHNLRYVCKSCHDREDDHFIKKNKNQEQQREYIFDKDGQLVAILPPIDSTGSKI